MKQQFLQLAIAIIIMIALFQYQRFNIPKDSIKPSEQKEENVIETMTKLHNEKHKFVSDPALQDYAQHWAEHLERIGKIKHSKMKYPGDWDHHGENIGYGDSAESVFEDWMSSEDHRDAINNKSFTHIGIGKSGKYWCVCFAGQ